MAVHPTLEYHEIARISPHNYREATSTAGAVAAARSRSPEACSEKSTAWAVKAAAAGDRVGQFRLAWAYQYGEGGLAVDFRQATAWFKRAAEQGCEASMNNLVRVSSLARAVSCSLSALRMLFFFFFSPATLTHAHPALPCGCSFIL